MLSFAAQAMQKFVICSFDDEETNGSYPFVNGLNGLNGLNVLAHLCLQEYFINVFYTD
jgi:hypothetical protein